MNCVPLADIRGVARRAGYPSSKGHLIARLEKEGAQRVLGEVAKGHRGFLYEVSTLPDPIKSALQPQPISEPPTAPFETYTHAAPSQRKEADRHVLMMHSLKRRLDHGVPLMDAYDETAAEFNVSKCTIERAWKKVRRASQTDWLALLVKDYKGRKPDDIAPEILATFFADYGRVEQPQLQAAYERTVGQAARKGWGEVPSARTLKRRWDKLPKATRVLMREGEKALDRILPYAERDRTGMKPLDGFNVDGREWDNMVEWPDGRQLRPVVTMVQDEATNYALGWIVGESESGDIYRRVLCDVFTRFGIPKRVLFDNTRAAANKALTAGAQGRNRFKDRPDDIEGLLPRIGCRPDFALPENGQSKLVERLFLEVKERSEKDPRLAGAYTGRSPSEKPANYGARAMPLELFKAVLAEAVEHYNSRTDRRGKVAYKTSYRALFEAGLAAVKVNRLTEAQRRYFFLVAERRTVTPDGSIRLGKEPHVNRYWSAELGSYAGQSVVVRYDPDTLSNPVLVETSDGVLIDDSVEIVEKRGFNSAADAREHMRSKRAIRKREKQNAAALVRLAELEHSYDMPLPATSAAPSAPVVAPDFKRKPALRAPASSPSDAERLSKGLARLEQKARYG